MTRLAITLVQELVVPLRAFLALKESKLRHEHDMIFQFIMPTKQAWTEEQTGNSYLPVKVSRLYSRKNKQINPFLF